MDSSLIAVMAAVLGSFSGASASILTTWMAQHNQNVRERTQAELPRAWTLYLIQ